MSCRRGVRRSKARTIRSLVSNFLPGEWKEESMETNEATGFVCRVCGERHVLAVSYSFQFPLAAGAVPKEEVEQRVVLTPDQCVIDNKDFYIRGRILVPIHGL